MSERTKRILQLLLIVALIPVAIWLAYNAGFFVGETAATSE